MDVSAFGPEDLANIALQRSSTLAGLALPPGRIVRAWSAGEPAPLSEAVDALGPEIARRAVTEIAADFADIVPALDPVSPRRIADIGCGYAIFDLFAARRWSASLVLIDLEAAEDRHFGFAATGAAYSSLGTARRFLEANGMAAAAIETVNPRVSDPAGAGQVDAVVSLLSCGFHYPVDTYVPYLTAALRPGGVAVFDLRESRAEAGMASLGALGSVEVIGTAPKVTRVRMTRSAPC